MNTLTSFATSSIGKKVLMALTGVGLIGFIIAHLLGNLLIFCGPEALNNYAASLKDLGGLLWIARGGLILIFILHIVCAIALTREKRAARPEAYQTKNNVKSSLASRNMGLSGTFILFFVVGHLLHYTLGYLYPEYFNFVDSENRHDVYRMVVSSFQHVEVAIPYIFSLMLLGSHLSHAMSSCFQTLGITHPTYTAIIEKTVPLLAMAITIGYIAIPVSVLGRIITL